MTKIIVQKHPNQATEFSLLRYQSSCYLGSQPRTVINHHFDLDLEPWGRRKRMYKHNSRVSHLRERDRHRIAKFSEQLFRSLFMRERSEKTAKSKHCFPRPSGHFHFTIVTHHQSNIDDEPTVQHNDRGIGSLFQDLFWLFLAVPCITRRATAFHLLNDLASESRRICCTLQNQLLSSIFPRAKRSCREACQRWALIFV